MNANFPEAYTKSPCIAVDESTILFKGRSCLKQYLPLKLIKRGFKIWYLADSKTGYLYKFQLYEGKNEVRPLTGPLASMLSLVQVCIAPGLQLFFNNYFTSPKLMKDFEGDGILAYGTFRSNQKDLPDEVKTDNKLDKGKYIWRSKAGVTVYQWKDTKNVHIKSNYHDASDAVEVERATSTREKKVKCPAIVRDCNSWVGGADKFDQHTSSYPLDRKSKRWWS